VAFESILTDVGKHLKTFVISWIVLFFVCLVFQGVSPVSVGGAAVLGFIFAVVITVVIEGVKGVKK